MCVSIHSCWHYMRWARSIYLYQTLTICKLGRQIQLSWPAALCHVQLSGIKQLLLQTLRTKTQIKTTNTTNRPMKRYSLFNFRVFSAFSKTPARGFSGSCSIAEIFCLADCSLFSGGVVDMVYIELSQKGKWRWRLSPNDKLNLWVTWLSTSSHVTSRNPSYFNNGRRRVRRDYNYGRSYC